MAAIAPHRAPMQIWQRNHAGGDICTRVIRVTDTLFHAEAIGRDERLATLDDRLRATLDLAEQRADEMARRRLAHQCQPHLCDAWHSVHEVVEHGAVYPLGSGGRHRSEPASILIVRRGRTAWADFLRRRLDSLSHSLVFSWDRRFTDRRRRRADVERDRRSSDRRGPPPAAWHNLHFILATFEEPRETR